MTSWRVRGVRLPDGTDLDAGVTGSGLWTSSPPGDAEPLPGRYVLPGLVDAHCHLSIATGPDGMPVPLDVSSARANLDAARAGGVTGVRDTGSPGSVTLALAPDGGLLPCGRFLAPAGQYFPALHKPVAAEDLVPAALAEVAAGARWVKLVGDFPVVAEGWPEPTPTYRPDSVVRLVEAVHAAGARVAAHTTTRYASRLIAAGVDSVEHGTDLAEADLPELATRAAAWTPTLCASVGGRSADDPERERRRRERREWLGHLLQRAERVGVTVLAGTDVVGSIPREVALLSELGLSPTAALAAASTAARRFLDLPDLVDGQPADLVTYDADPSTDPAVLAQPVAVFSGGVRIR
jgi:imidazolonepropionase-like amidohydrolase